MIKLQRIGHILLNVRDVEKSKAFYMKILGFELLEQDPEHGGVFLSLGEHGNTLDLFPCSNPDESPQPKAVPGDRTGLGRQAHGLRGGDRGGAEAGLFLAAGRRRAHTPRGRPRQPEEHLLSRPGQQPARNRLGAAQHPGDFREGPARHRHRDRVRARLTAGAPARGHRSLLRPSTRSPLPEPRINSSSTPHQAAARLARL